MASESVESRQFHRPWIGQRYGPANANAPPLLLCWDLFRLDVFSLVPESIAQKGNCPPLIDTDRAISIPTISIGFAFAA
jgi:hypothetical protein